MRALAKMSAAALALMVSAAPAFAQPSDDETEAFVARCQLFNECEEDDAPVNDDVVGSQEGEVADGTPRRPRTRGRLEIALPDQPQVRPVSAQRQRSTVRRSTRSAAAIRARDAARREARQNPGRGSRDFRFNTGSATMTSLGWRQAQIWGSTIVSRNQTQRVRIVGHTDATGDAERNRALSLARAQSVADAFAAGGIDRSRIEVVGMGEEMANGSTNPRHRRVEIIMVN